MDGFSLKPLLQGGERQIAGHTLSYMHINCFVLNCSVTLTQEIKYRTYPRAARRSSAYVNIPDQTVYHHKIARCMCTNFLLIFKNSEIACRSVQFVFICQYMSPRMTDKLNSSIYFMWVVIILCVLRLLLVILSRTTCSFVILMTEKQIGNAILKMRSGSEFTLYTAERFK